MTKVFVNYIKLPYNMGFFVRNYPYSLYRYHTSSSLKDWIKSHFVYI